MLTQADSPLTTPTVIIDQDLDPQAAGLYRVLKEILDSLNINNQDFGVVVFGGGNNIHTGHVFLAGGAQTITIGLTMPNTNYHIIATQGDGFSESSVRYSNKTETTFDLTLSGETNVDCSWLVAY